jgi:hypothetical protein
MKHAKRDKKGRFKKGAAAYRIRMRAALWASIGFLLGIIAEMFVQLIPK